MKKRKVFVFIFCFCFFSGWGQLTTKEVVMKSIEYHDPLNQLHDNDITFYFEESRPNGTKNSAEIRLAPNLEKHKLLRERDGDYICYEIMGDKVGISLNSKSELTDEIIAKYKLSDERGIMLKNYYLYLWHLPRKLLDPGTIIHEELMDKDFFGQQLYEVKVSYTPEVGKDIWYFYFDKKTFALSGYRFYHDESKNDGEYILFEDELIYNEIKIPKIRKWYTHSENKYLGTDTLVKLQFENPN